MAFLVDLTQEEFEKDIFKPKVIAKAIHLGLFFRTRFAESIFYK